MNLPLDFRKTRPTSPERRTLSALLFAMSASIASILSVTLAPPSTVTYGPFSTAKIRSSIMNSLATILPAQVGISSANPTIEGGERCAVGKASRMHASRCGASR